MKILRCKLLVLFIIAVLLSTLSGCGWKYTKEMSDADIAKSAAYGQAMAAYYQSVSDKIPTKVASVGLDADGRVKSFDVYNTNVNLPPPPVAPRDIKPTAVQQTESITNSAVVGKALDILGMGLIVHIATDKAGDRNSNNTGSNNSSVGPQSIATGPGSIDNSATAITTDDSQHSSNVDSGNTTTTTQTDVNNDKSDNSQSDVGNTDQSQHDVGNDKSDNRVDNSDNSVDNRTDDSIDNSINNQDQFSGDTNNVFPAPENPVIE